MEKKQTYGEAIESLQDQTNQLYEKIGALRDYAIDNEKDPCNKLRGIYRNAWLELKVLSKLVYDADRSDMELEGKY